MKLKNQTAKTSAKSAAKTTATATVWLDGKQLYRHFKSIDIAAYQRQGELTLCGARSGKVRASDKALDGKAIILWQGAQGQCALRGALVDGGKAMQAGKFVLSLEGLKGLRKFDNEASLASFIWREGEKSELYGIGKNLRIIAGSKYSFLSDGKKVWRHESNTCARGKNFFTATFK